MTSSYDKPGKNKSKLEQSVKNNPAGAPAGGQEKPGKTKNRSVPERPLGQTLTPSIGVERRVIPASGVEFQGERPVGVRSGNEKLPATLAWASPIHFQPEPAGKLYGVYPAIVIDIKDPNNLGRVKIEFPWMTGPEYDCAEHKNVGYWARLATLMAGCDKGSWFIPDVNDEVLVAFEGGEPNHPYVIGALWNGTDRPPENMDGAGHNFYKEIVSRKGVRIKIDDSDGQERLELETPGGQKITLRDRPGSICIEDSNGNSLQFDASGITLNASGNLKLNASMIELGAGLVIIDSGCSNFSGAVNCDSLITNSVVSSSYTPGPGNIW